MTAAWSICERCGGMSHDGPCPTDAPYVEKVPAGERWAVRAIELQAEVERLRERNVELTRLAENATADYQGLLRRESEALIDRNAEVERLRGAMEQIAKLGEEYWKSAEIASAALKGES